MKILDAGKNDTINIQKQVIGIITENSNNQEQNISFQTSIREIGVSSIAFIKIVVTIEAEFDIEFDDEDLDYNNYKTINDIILYVEKRLSEKKSNNTRNE